MRFTSFITVSIFIGLAFPPVIAFPDQESGTQLRPRRTASILNNPDAQPDLPTAPQAAKAAAAASLDLNNIQGDILVGMKKRKEKFFFFHINNVKLFKATLKAVSSKITTTTQLLDINKQPNAMINVAFSQSGLTALGIKDDLGDEAFTAGMQADATNLGDPGTKNWVKAFAGTNIHGVFLLASDSTLLIDVEWLAVKVLFGASITETYTLSGQARPGSEEGHEHFGFMDGISQPAVKGFTSNPVPGQTFIEPGLLLLGESGDATTRPAWAKDGSFLAFRQLKQLVPEFNKFLTDNPITLPGLSRKQGSDLMGARMVGRWKSGAPVDLAPKFDDPVLAKDPLRNNNFDFSHPGEDLGSDQTRCPFSAHIRKTAPRADFSPVNTQNHIMRAGIPYGPEVSRQEASSNKTTTERGLAFVAYQSDLSLGFQFMQRRWANNPGFIFNKNDTTPGFDPIIGQNQGGPRNVSGLFPNDPNKDVTLVIDFVESRGGEYFFSPSISAIKNIITK